jgi:hypothetical protein
MKITYELEKDDLIKNSKYTLKHNAILKRIWIGYIVFIFVVNYWPLIYLFIPEYWQRFDLVYLLKWLIYPTVSFAFYIVVTPLLTKLINSINIRHQANKHRYGDGVLGQHTIILEEDSFVEITDVNESRHKWKSIFRLEDTKDYIFLFISPQNYLSIPKKYFASEADAENFLDEAKRLHENSRTNFSHSYLASNV